jgi:hypothetical protein
MREDSASDELLRYYFARALILSALKSYPSKPTQTVCRGANEVPYGGDQTTLNLCFSGYVQWRHDDACEAG